MNGIIIEDDERKYTSLKEIFNAINDEQKKYNWLITGSEYAPSNKDMKNYDRPFEWISGEELTERANFDDDFWVWGVLSAFNKDISKEEVLKYDFPYVNGYVGFWNNPLTIQHPLASIEFVEWDGTLFLAITNDQKILMDLKTVFPTAKDLIDYNNEP